MAGRGTAHLSAEEDVLLKVENLEVSFPTSRGMVRAVSELTFDVRRGETLGLVGESGCGKSTTGRAILHLPTPSGGRITFDGIDLGSLDHEELRRLRPRLQMIFQDPVSSLNPRRRIEDIVAEGLQIWRPLTFTWLTLAAAVLLGIGVLALVASVATLGVSSALFFGLAALIVGGGLVLAHMAGVAQPTAVGEAAQVDEALNAVGLDPDTVRGRRPHQFSGGQCQRISIARAVITEPDLIICDEPVSALDVSVQAQILNLLEDLKVRYGLTLVFIAHDLAVVKNISDRVAVMYLGRLCEIGPSDLLFASPAHPYTQILLEAIPEPDPQKPRDPRPSLSGDLPSPINPPSGCRFRTRCPAADQICVDEVPEIRSTGDGRFVACHNPLVDVTAVELSSAPPK